MAKTKKQIEQGEINSLLDKGIIYKAGPYNFTITQPYLGTLDRLTNEYIKIDFDLEKANSEPLNELKYSAYANAKTAARIVAIATLNSYWGIKLLTGVFSLYLFWKLKPVRLYEIAQAIHLLSSLENFTYAIQLLHLRPRVTQTKAEIAEVQASIAPLEKGGP